MKRLYIYFMFGAVLAAGCSQGNAQAASSGGADVMDKVQKSKAEWKAILTPEQYRVLREAGTERPFSGKYYKHNEDGVYTCGACGAELFKSDTKFDAHCGWPSFYEAIDEGKIIERQDVSHGMVRTEVVCAKCKSHLGHVFNDGPKPTGLRYCINSVSMGFIKEDDLSEETIVLGAGCFWCTDAVYQEIPGVKSVTVGFMGGTTKDPSYKDVVRGDTGHAEVGKIVFDPSRVSLPEILDIYWKAHDPTSLNRQGADVGTQYRSVIFYTDDDQKEVIEESIRKAQKKLDRPIVTAVEKADEFYEAEGYHQNYYNLNKNQPYCRAVIAPKLDKVLGK